MCIDGAPKVVGACVYAGPPPDDQYSGEFPPFSFAGSVTVTAVRPTSPDEPCVTDNWWWYTVGSAHPDTMIDVVDAKGTSLTLGIVAPGFSPSTVAVGDTLDIDFNAERTGAAIQPVAKTRLRIERGGELVVTVGANEPVVPFAEGAHECYTVQEDPCGFEHIVLQAEDADGASISIPSGTSAEVGSLLVANEKYRAVYDITGSCNFGVPIEYIVSAAPKP
jgi:hypothetical protein